MERAAARFKRTLLAVLVIAAVSPSTATAGTYPVVGGCGNWTPRYGPAKQMAVYGDCSVLVVRNVGGAFMTPWGTTAEWQFLPPPRTVIGAVSMSGTIIGRDGWHAGIQTTLGLDLEECPKSTCSGGRRAFSFTTQPLLGTHLLLYVACWHAVRCPNDKGIAGMVSVNRVVLNIEDSTSPAVTIAGGDLLAGWRRQRGTVRLSASDNVGIKLDRLLVDGVPREQRARPCSWGRRIPCPTGPATLSLDTTLLSDGPHTLTLQSIDSANNIAGASRVIQVDNTPPTAPQHPAVAGGSAWRATNSFDLTWTNPPQPHAPVVGARYELCPVTTGADCVTGLWSGPQLSAVPNLSVPSPGAWRLRWWLVDAAGNQDPRSAAETLLQFDNVPPAVAFQRSSTADPARVRVAARDANSGTADVEIEARRTGENLWRSLPAQPSGQDYTAFMDDEKLPRGAYQLRAWAQDTAGNERSTTTRVDGQAAVMTLPVRDRAVLRAGRAYRQCGRARGRRRCSLRLDSAPKLDYGQRLYLTGRLGIAGRPGSGPVEIYERLMLPGSAWKRTATVVATAGRFRHVLAAGPARRLRVRFAGSATARGATASVDARVRAASTFDVSRRDVVNGEYVRFRGRLRGGYLPAGGKLVELQVFTRRRWRTFALPRADARSGRWSYDYRFETIRGTARFRFRARIRREAGYPFHAGTSRQVRVLVHGI